MAVIELASWKRNTRLEAALNESKSPTAGPRYLYSEEQKRVVERMAANYVYIVAQALRGTPSKVIAAGHGVSREAIDLRLRPLGLKNPPGVLGRPKGASVERCL